MAIVKVVLLTILVSGINLYVFSQDERVNQFTLKGRVIGKRNGAISLTYINEKGASVTDTSLMENGCFYFEGNINEPTRAFLKLDTANICHFFLESEVMTFQAEMGHFDQKEISGSKTQNEYAQLTSKSKQLDTYEDISDMNFQFASTHPSSYVSAWLLAIYQTRWPLDTLRSLYNSLNSNVQDSFFGKEVGQTLSQIETNSSGDIARDFSDTTLDGQVISLSEFKGKYVLLDFWASWCNPCRQSFPHLKELYDRYHKRGFEIIAISSDRYPERWKEAINSDGIDSWHNLLSNSTKDENGDASRSNTIGYKYGVIVLPTKILIDTKGVIIQRIVGSGTIELERVLSELFGKQ